LQAGDARGQDVIQRPGFREDEVPATL